MATEDSPYEPSYEEARLYYYDLPSRPSLVARSSEQQWQHKLPGEFFPQIKLLRHIGKHPIIDSWDARLQKQIIDTLEGINWTSIDIVRIGYEIEFEGQENYYPVVLWIGVSPESLSWRDGMKIVNSCITILKSHELFDVQCEIRESSIWRQTRPQTNVQYLSPVHQDNVTARYQLRLTASAGQSTGSRDSHWEGTLGPYLKSDAINPQSQKMWALTCKHVVHPREAWREMYQYKSGTGQPCKEMLSPGNDTLRHLNEEVKSAHRSYSNLLRQQEEALRRALPEAVNEVTQYRDMTRTKINDIQDFKDRILPMWQDENNRVIGHVVYGPPLQATQPIDSAADECGPVRDWALIELYQNKFSEPVTNTVDLMIEQPYDIGQLSDMLNPHSANSHRFVVPWDEKLRLHHIVPLSELRRPTTLDKSGDPCLIVGKRGRTTGITWGCGTGLNSVTRDVKTGVRSMEFCVVHGIGQNSFVPFSKPGDSGSVVFDATGRVVGMLNAGGGRTDVADTTYVTPMAWLQQDLKEHGYTVEIA